MAGPDFTLEEMQAAGGLIAVAMRIEGIGYAALCSPHLSSFVMKLEAAAKAKAAETEKPDGQPSD